jgi:hypothetical protein
MGRVLTRLDSLGGNAACAKREPRTSAMAALARAKQTWNGIKAAWAILGWLGFTGFLVGIATAFAGAAWAVINGIAAPIVVMAALCVFTAAVYLAMAPMAFRVLQRAQEVPIRTRPDPEIWRHLKEMRLFEAACLLADIEPDLPTVSRPGDAYAWYRALCNAVNTKEMTGISTPFDGHHINNGVYHAYEETVISRDVLKRFADERQVRRAFLEN